MAIPKLVRRVLWTLATITFVLLLGGWLLIISGIWIPNYPPSMYVEHEGIDVSHHQGHIDWDKVRTQHWSFAYLKASEGTGWTDPRFSENAAEATRVELDWGAYHYFAFNNSGKAQAAHFAKALKGKRFTLSPAIDVEFDHASNKQELADSAAAELQIMIDECVALGMPRPIIYTSWEAHAAILKGRIKARYWIRDLWSTPEPIEDEDWLIWQFTDRGRVAGIQGFVDLNGTNEGTIAWLNKECGVTYELGPYRPKGKP